MPVEGYTGPESGARRWEAASTRRRPRYGARCEEERCSGQKHEHLQPLMEAPIALGVVLAAAALRLITAFRKNLEHPGENYARYRQLTGFSILVTILGAIAAWLLFGELAFLLVMCISQLAFLGAIKAYETRLERDAQNKPVDKALTELINGVAGVLTIVGIVFAIAQL